MAAVTRSDATPVSFHLLTKIFAAFQPDLDGSGWRSVQQVCEALPQICRRVDMRALVHVGLLNGILRGLQTVPMMLDPEASLAEPSARQPPTATLLAAAEVRSLAMGHHDLEEVGCKVSSSPQEAKRTLVAACGPCAWISL